MRQRYTLEFTADDIDMIVLPDDETANFVSHLYSSKLNDAELYIKKLWRKDL